MAKHEKAAEKAKVATVEPPKEVEVPQPVEAEKVEENSVDMNASNEPVNPMPVEVQAKVHELAVVKNSKHVLQRGRRTPINDSLLGDFEMALMDAEEKGDMARAAVINNVMVHVGSLVRYAREVERQGMLDLLPLLHRVSELLPSL